MRARLLLFVIALLSVETTSQEREEMFTEELVLRPASGGDVAAFFTFTTVSSSDGNGPNLARSDFHLFPRAVGDLMEAHGVREIDLSLTRGVWRDKRWGR